MELNRRCVKTCDAAIAADGACLKAYLLKGKALEALGKVSWSADAPRRRLSHGGFIATAARRKRSSLADAFIATTTTATATAATTAGQQGEGRLVGGRKGRHSRRQPHGRRGHVV